MKKFLFGALAGLVMVISAMAFNGCGTKSYEKQRYLLNARRSAPTEASVGEDIVEVRRFTIDPAFSAKALTYRNSEFEYESDFYNEFLVGPDVMITEKFRDWMSKSGIFRRVLAPGSYSEPTYAMEGSVNALYGDLRDRTSASAVMEISVCMLKMNAGAEPAIVFNKTYSSSVAVEKKRPKALVGALDSCLVKILASCESDLAKVLQ